MFNKWYNSLAKCFRFDHKLPEVSYSPESVMRRLGICNWNRQQGFWSATGGKESIPKWNRHYWVSQKNVPSHSGQPIRNSTHSCQFFQWLLCVIMVWKIGLYFLSFFFFFNQEKTRCIWSSKATLSEKQFRMWWKANACLLKPQLFPHLPVSVIPETAALKVGWGLA